MSEQTALTPIDAPGALDLVTRRKPAVVLEEAREAAVAIKAVIDAKPTKVTMNGETYLEFEDWQTVGRFYGLTTEVEWTRPVSLGDVRGWEAAVVVKMVSTGQAVGRAEAMCLNDEAKWSTRAKYGMEYELKDGRWVSEEEAQDLGTGAWKWIAPRGGGKNRPSKRRVKVGDEAVPMFQLRSMAQTRAGAKALRNVLSWVVVLAGYKPTPAEELDGLTEREPSQPSQPRPVEETPTGFVQPEGAVRVMETRPLDGGGIELVLHTGEVLKATLKKLCANLQALDQDQPVLLTVSNGFVTKMAYAPNVLPIEGAQERTEKLHEGDVPSSEIPF